MATKKDGSPRKHRPSDFRVQQWDYQAKMWSDLTLTIEKTADGKPAVDVSKRTGSFRVINVKSDVWTIQEETVTQRMVLEGFPPVQPKVDGEIDAQPAPEADDD